MFKLTKSDREYWLRLSVDSYLVICMHSYWVLFNVDFTGGCFSAKNISIETAVKSLRIIKNLKSLLLQPKALFHVSACLKPAQERFPVDKPPKRVCSLQILKLIVVLLQSPEHSRVFVASESIISNHEPEEEVDSETLFFGSLFLEMMDVTVTKTLQCSGLWITVTMGLSICQGEETYLKSRN